MIIIVNVKKRLSQGSVLTPVSRHEVSMALPRKGVSMALYILWQSRDEGNSYDTARTHVSPQAVLATVTVNLTMRFLTHDSSGSRYPMKMPVCPCVSVTSVAWYSGVLERESQRCEKAASWPLLVSCDPKAGDSSSQEVGLPLLECPDSRAWVWVTSSRSS